MTKNINDMTQQEFDELMVNIKTKYPKLFQIIQDFVNKKFSSEEIDNLISMGDEEQLHFINSYQARA